MTTKQLTEQDGTNVPVPEEGEAEKVSTPEAQTSTKQEQDNKAYRALQSAIDKANAKIAALEEEKQSKTKDSESKSRLSKEVQSFIDEGTDETEVQKYAKAKEAFTQEIRAYEKNAKALDAREQGVNEKADKVVLIERMTPKTDEIFKDALTQMAEADSPKAKELMAEKLSSGLKEKIVLAMVEDDPALREKLKTTLITKEKPGRPDSSAPSATTGRSIDNMSPREKIEAGLNKSKK